MRKLPQDMSFPLGKGSKGSKDDSKNSGQKSFDIDDKDKDHQSTAPVQDLDTINL